MQVSELGKSGLTCGRIGLGCTTFGREISEEESFRIMDYAVENGITLFDTAEAYGGGQARAYRKNYLGVDDQREVSGEMHSSEKIVGRWMKSRGARKNIVLLTKVTTNFTREHVREALAASLERLQTDSVDLYLYHSYDGETPVAETVAAAAEGVAKGLAKAAGCSNHTGAQLKAALDESKAQGCARFEVIENNYNLAVRDIETDVLPITQAEKIGVLGYSPLAAGFFAGKYTADRDAMPAGSRFHVIPGHADIYFKERNFGLVEKMRELSERTGLSTVRLAMGWALSNPAIDVVLAGARHIGHLENAVEAEANPLPAELVSEMSAW